MKQLFVFLIVLQFSTVAKAQYTMRTIDDVRKELKNAIAKVPGKKPMYLIGEVLTNSLKNFDTLSIRAVSIMPKEQAIKRYGDKAKKGVIEIDFFVSGVADQIAGSGFGNYDEPPFEGFDKQPLEPRKVESAEKIYEKVEIEGKFKGKFNKFLEQNLRYPQSAIDDGIQGNVLIKFIIEIDGTLSRIQVSENSPQTNAVLVSESIRILTKSSGLWEPGVQSGKKVRTYHEQSINFVLADDDEEVSLPSFRYFEQFVDSVMKYPKAAKKQKIEGPVALQFTVNENGTIENIKLSDYSEQKNELLVKEAIRILQLSSGRWTAALSNGKAIKTMTTTVINFKLPKK